MIRKLIAVGVVLLVAGVAAGFVAEGGPGPLSDDGNGTEIESFPTETPGPDASGDGGGGDGDGSDGSDAGSADSTATPFTFTVDRVEKCGETCRDVTTTLTNEQSTDASDVTAYTRIYAGNGTDGEIVWEGTEPVGDLGAGESYTTTERVDLSLTDAYAIERNGGWITVQTTVESDGETMTTTEQRRVA